MSMGDVKPSTCRDSQPESAFLSIVSDKAVAACSVMGGGRQGHHGRLSFVPEQPCASVRRPLLSPPPGQEREAPEIAGHDVRSFRSEEHTSELQSLMRISYAVFCLKKKKK